MLLYDHSFREYGWPKNLHCALDTCPHAHMAGAKDSNSLITGSQDVYRV